jgi:hypothetical protein
MVLLCHGYAMFRGVIDRGKIDVLRAVIESEGIGSGRWRNVTIASDGASAIARNTHPGV